MYRDHIQHSNLSLRLPSKALVQALAVRYFLAPPTPKTEKRQKHIESKTFGQTQFDVDGIEAVP